MKERKKQHIFRTSMALFQEKGYENVTVSEIVEACGVAKGTFFNYFPKKDDVLLYFGAMQIEEVVQVWERKDLPIDQWVLGLFNELLTRFRATNLGPSVVRSLMQSSVAREEEYERIDGWVMLIARKVEASIGREGMNESLDPTVVAHSWVALYFYTILRMDWDYPEEQMRAMFRAQWEGMRR